VVPAQLQNSDYYYRQLEEAWPLMMNLSDLQDHSPVIITLTYKVLVILTFNQPPYVSYSFGPSLYSCSYSPFATQTLLSEPAVSTIIGSQGFTYTAPSIWNEIPPP